MSLTPIHTWPHFLRKVRTVVEQATSLLRSWNGFGVSNSVGHSHLATSTERDENRCKVSELHMASCPERGEYRCDRAYFYSHLTSSAEKGMGHYLTEMWEQAWNEQLCRSLHLAKELREVRIGVK